MRSKWMRVRWFDFRQGHSLYLIFALTFSNFILIFHRLLIERVPALEQVFSNLWMFIAVFVLAYIPVAILVGAWHRKKQLRIDQEYQIRENPLFAKMFRMVIDIQTGKASKEEIENFRKFLIDIEEGHSK